MLKPVAVDTVMDIWHEKKDKRVDSEDQMMLTLSNSKGWKVLRQHIESLKIGLDRRLSKSVLESVSDTQIKTDALFAVLGKDLLDSIISKVEDTALAVEQIKNGRAED
jgi:hypothetical protein